MEEKWVEAPESGLGSWELGASNFGAGRPQNGERKKELGEDGGGGAGKSRGGPCVESESPVSSESESELDQGPCRFGQEEWWSGGSKRLAGHAGFRSLPFSRAPP